MRKLDYLLLANIRRHRCEICNQIFDCHLCRVDLEHQLHKTRSERELSTYYVCETCILSDPTRHLTVLSVTRHRVSVYDHLTGDMIESNILLSDLESKYGRIKDAFTKT